MPWKGPEKDGITQSLLNRFRTCPFSFYIYAILGLEESETSFPENLCWGDAYHVGLENYIASHDYVYSCGKMIEHLKKQWPAAPPTFQHSLRKMLMLYTLPPGEYRTEQEFKEVVEVYGRKVVLRGKMDGIGTHPDYGQVLLEHKCKGSIYPEQLKSEIKEDIQCNLYMYLADVEWVLYDLIKIPDVQRYGPNRAYDESPKAFIDRLYTGPIGSYGNKYPINRCKESWIHQHPYLIERDQQEDFWQRTLRPLLAQMVQWWDYVNQPGFDFQNPKYYNSLFYKAPIRHFDPAKTESFKCPYYNYLTGESNLSDLSPVTSYFAELSP